MATSFSNHQVAIAVCGQSLRLSRQWPPIPHSHPCTNLSPLAGSVKGSKLDVYLGFRRRRHRCYNDGAKMRVFEYEHALNESVTNPLE